MLFVLLLWRARAPAADRWRHARVRDHRDAAGAAADRKPGRDLVAGPVAEAPARRREAAEVPHRADEAHPPARTPLPAPPVLPLPPSRQQHRLWVPDPSRVARRVPRATVHRARHASRRSASCSCRSAYCSRTSWWTSSGSSSPAPASCSRSSSARPPSKVSAACSSAPRHGGRAGERRPGRSGGPPPAVRACRC